LGAPQTIDKGVSLPMLTVVRVSLSALVAYYFLKRSHAFYFKTNGGKNAGKSCWFYGYGQVFTQPFV